MRCVLVLYPLFLSLFSNLVVQRAGVCYFCLAVRHDGVGRVGLGPPVGVFPLFTPEFTAEKEVFRINHDVNLPPQVCDLVLVGLESGLP